MGSQQQDLRQIYHHIIDDVVAKMKPGFLQESVDESVLQTIRQRWSQKLTEKGIISDPEPQAPPPDAVAIKRDEDAASRKRPYDGTAPNSRQEAAAALAGAGAPSGVNMALQGPPAHMRPAGQAAAGVPGMRPAHPQMPGMGRGVGPAAMAGAQQQQQLPQLQLMQLMASVQHLPPQQQQAALQMQIQAMQRNAAAAQAQLRAQGGAPAGMPAQAGMGLNQGLPAGQQLQNLQGLRAPGVPPQMLAQQQQAQLQQQILQQQALQQQQQQQAALRMQQGLPAGLPAGLPGNLQLLQQQGVVQQRIPQGDGSADPPPSMAEVAASAGMQPDQLRAMLPKRLAAIIDRSSGAATSSGRSPPAAAAAGQPATAVAGLGDAVPPAGHAGQASAVSSSSRRKPPVRRRRRSSATIPQVDGNGDDGEEDEEDYGGDYEGGDEEAGGEEEGDDDDESGSQDDQELAKFTAELDDLEEADKEDTADVGFALYEKVHRAKNRWRCNLRYGVFLINGKEYMFNKGSTDFTF